MFYIYTQQVREDEQDVTSLQILSFSQYKEFENKD